MAMRAKACGCTANSSSQARKASAFWPMRMKRWPIITRGRAACGAASRARTRAWAASSGWLRASASWAISHQWWAVRCENEPVPAASSWWAISMAGCQLRERSCSDSSARRASVLKAVPSSAWKASSARSNRPAFMKSWARACWARSRSSRFRSARASRCWCTRMARSYSPRRRNRLPRAKCRSEVSGSCCTASMKASMALSCCSLSSRLRPLK